MSEISHLPEEQQPIIIADADPENASHVERQLRRAGVKNPVMVFENGDDLNAFLADAGQNNACAPCVLFLDPRMPGANGYDPVRWVKREKCGAEIMVAIFSSPDQSDEVEVANDLGVHLFLKKLPDLSSLSPVVVHLGGMPMAEASTTPDAPAARVA